MYRTRLWTLALGALATACTTSTPAPTAPAGQPGNTGSAADSDITLQGTWVGRVQASAPNCEVVIGLSLTQAAHQQTPALATGTLVVPDCGNTGPAESIIGRLALDSATFPGTFSVASTTGPVISITGRLVHDTLQGTAAVLYSTIAGAAPVMYPVTLVRGPLSDSGASASRPPSPNPVAHITVSPDTITLPQGSTVVTYIATLTDASGKTLTGIGVRWSSSDSGIAQPAQGDTTTTLYVAESQDTGTAIITATAEGQHGTARLRVVPMPSVSLTGTWISDSIAYPTDVGYCETTVPKRIELVMVQVGDSVQALEIAQLCTQTALVFTDTLAAESGPITSPPCEVGTCLLSLTMEASGFSEGGDWKLALTTSADTLANVTPSSLNHSFMPTTFVRQLISTGDADAAGHGNRARDLGRMVARRTGRPLVRP